MPNWKKIIVSGSQAELQSLVADNLLQVSTNQIISSSAADTKLSGSFSGSFQGDGSGLTGLPVDLEISGSTGNGSVNLLTGALSVIGTDSISTVATDSGDDLSVNISIRDASTTQKGAAQFNSDDFSVASGVVSLSDSASGAVLAVQGTANEVEVSRTNGTVTVGLPNSVNITENLTVGGNLTIQGTVTEIQTTNLLVEDRYILLNSGSVGDVDKGGIIVDSGGGVGKAFILGEASGRWGFTGSLAHDSSTATPDAFAAAVVTSEIAEYEKVGNIRVDEGTGEIFIYS